MEEILEESGPTVEEVVAPVTDAETRRALRANDEEEDFLDEGAVKRICKWLYHLFDKTFHYVAGVLFGRYL